MLQTTVLNAFATRTFLSFRTHLSTLCILYSWHQLRYSIGGKQRVCPTPFLPVTVETEPVYHATITEGKRVACFVDNAHKCIGSWDPRQSVFRTVTAMHNAIHWSQGFPGSSVVKNLFAHSADGGSIPVSGRSPEDGNGYLLQ